MFDASKCLHSNRILISTFQRETKPKIWAYMLWKQAYLQTNPAIGEDEENPWRLYQQWMKLDESTRQSWLVAGGTIQAFDKVRLTLLTYCELQLTLKSSAVRPRHPTRNSSKNHQNFDTRKAAYAASNACSESSCEASRSRWTLSHRHREQVDQASRSGDTVS